MSYLENPFFNINQIISGLVKEEIGSEIVNFMWGSLPIAKQTKLESEKRQLLLHVAITTAWNLLDQSYERYSHMMTDDSRKEISSILESYQSDITELLDAKFIDESFYIDVCGGLLGACQSLYLIRSEGMETLEVEYYHQVITEPPQSPIWRVLQN